MPEHTLYRDKRNVYNMIFSILVISNETNIFIIYLTEQEICPLSKFSSVIFLVQIIKQWGG